MRVLQIIDKLNVGGAEKVLVDLSNLLFEQGVHVSVLSLLDRGPLSDYLHKDIPHYYLNRKWRWEYNSVFRLNKLLNDFDIVHIHSRHNLRYFVFATWFRIRKPKLVFHDHYGNITIDDST